MITLNFANLTLPLTRFAEGNYPRERLNPPEISRSQWGTPLRTGTAYEAPHTWQISVYLSEDEADTLEAIYGAYIAAPAAVRVWDQARKYAEPSPRTRALVPGTSETAKGEQVLYFAQFNAEFSGPVSLGKAGNWRQATFTLVETFKVAA